MTANLITIAFRSLRKRLSYTILNIAGLATSIAFALLLWMYVHDQTSYDKDFVNSDRVYRANLEADMNGKIDVYSNVPQPVAAALKSTYTWIEDVANAGILRSVYEKDLMSLVAKANCSSNQSKIFTWPTNLCGNRTGMAVVRMCWRFLSLPFC